MKKISILALACLSLFSCNKIEAAKEIKVETAPTNVTATNPMVEEPYPDNVFEYEPLSKDPFKEYKNANLIIDYYVSDGWSTSDRHSYEIIVIDNQIMFGFGSPQSDSHREVRYEKKIALSPSDSKEIIALLEKADIKQVRTGIPKPDASAHKKEVLLVRNGGKKIAGGLFSYTIHEDGATAEDIASQTIETRRETASISGNYDLLFENLKKRFTNLDSLITVSVKKE
jgi:hypothetical protein